MLVMLASLGQPAWAEKNYPTQKITFQVAFAAGGIADVVARLIAQKLSQRVGQQVVVENRGGASGNLAAKVDDLRTVAIVAVTPVVLAVHPSNPAHSLQEFIINARTKSFTYGSAGIGTGPHFGAEYFFREVAKVQAVHVPFTGGAAAVGAAVGNHVDAVVLTLPTLVPPITQGLLCGLGIASATRNPAVPNVPTYGEMGFPNVYSDSWVGFFAPAKTPQAVVAKLNAEINVIMKEPQTQQKLKAIGFDALIKTRLEAEDYFRSQVAAWGKMIRAIGYASD